MNNLQNLEEMIVKIGTTAEEKMESATTAEEYAFLFGNLNVAAALASAINRSSKTIHLSLDYGKALTAYKASKKEAEEAKKEYHQISLDELFPKLFKALKAVLEEDEKEEPKKPITKKPTKKE